jgi:hypothetical protein
MTATDAPITNEQWHAQGLYYGQQPMEPVAMQAGQRVKLDTDRRWWTVRGLTAHTVVLTRQAEFQARGALVYTVIDWRAGVRGPVNVVGQGWDVDTDEQCQQLAELVRDREWGDLPMELVTDHGHPSEVNPMATTSSVSAAR